MFSKALTLGGVAKRVNYPLDELSLCQRIAQGETQLFGQLIDKYQGLIAGAIAAQGVDRSDVEDLAQQAFINAYKGLAGFRGEAKLSSWLYRIAINVARQHLKRLAIKPRPDSVEEGQEVGFEPTGRRHDEPTSQSMTQRALTAALKQLTKEQRTALSLYYFEELSYEEIAEAMGFNLNTIRTHIRRGKLKLSELLDQSMLES